MPALLVLLLAAAPVLPRASVRASKVYEPAIAAAVADTAHVFAVPPSLIKAIIQRESAWRPRVVSHAGAVGLMQVMPANARALGLSKADLWDPTKNILAGTRLLAVLLKHYKGDVISALAAYNARPRKLFAPLPDNGETPEYVAAVLRYWEAYRGAPLPRSSRGSSWGSLLHFATPRSAQ